MSGADIVIGPDGSVVSGDGSDLLVMKPLGSGQEVGRSCHYLEFKAGQDYFRAFCIWARLDNKIVKVGSS